MVAVMAFVTRQNPDFSSLSSLLRYGSKTMFWLLASSTGLQMSATMDDHDHSLCFICHGVSSVVWPPNSRDCFRAD